MVTKRSGLAFFSSGLTARNLDFKKDISVYIIISKESQNCKNTWSSRLLIIGAVMSLYTRSYNIQLSNVNDWD